MDILMTIIACLFIAAVVGLIVSCAWITKTVLDGIALGKRAYRRIQTPIDAGKQVVSAAKGAALAAGSHIKAIVADAQAATQAVSADLAIIAVAGQELAENVREAKGHIDHIIDSGAGEEAVKFFGGLISLMTRMREEGA